MAQFLRNGFAVSLLRPSLRGLGLVAEDEVELVLVAGTLPARFGTLIACRLRLIALLESLAFAPGDRLTRQATAAR